MMAIDILCKSKSKKESEDIPVQAVEALKVARG
jgi:hypothetical protein